MVAVYPQSVAELISKRVLGERGTYLLLHRTSAGTLAHSSQTCGRNADRDLVSDQCHYAATTATNPEYTICPARRIQESLLAM